MMPLIVSAQIKYDANPYNSVRDIDLNKRSGYSPGVHVNKT